MFAEVYPGGGGGKERTERKEGARRERERKEGWGGKGGRELSGPLIYMAFVIPM